MNGRDTFSTYNPIINFVFYIGAIVFSVVFLHPVFLAITAVMAAAYYLSIKGAAGLKLVAAMIPVFIALSVLNPLLNTGGTHVLFEYMNGRPYTMEALCYGMALGAMFVAVILWFASYNTVMTSDKFIYIFGRIIPSLSLILTMVLRLVPEFMKKTHQISGARKCVGKAVNSGTAREKAAGGLTILSALTTWALEGGIITADSMRSRGYGSGKRTSFSVYSFKSRDTVLLCSMVLLIILVAIAAAGGGMAASYTPELMMADTGSVFMITGAAAYFILLAIPTALNILEAITWHILRSRI